MRICSIPSIDRKYKNRPLWSTGPHLRVFLIIICPNFVFVDNHRLQDFDNGYFENFGSRLQRKIQDVEQNIAAPAFEAASKQVTDSPSLRTIEEGENDSGTETLHDTDSEPDDQQSKQEDLIEEFTGLNVSMSPFD